MDEIIFELRDKHFGYLLMDSHRKESLIQWANKENLCTAYYEIKEVICSN